MWHVVIALALLAHGVGHAVGFWMPVPAWFRLLWLLPGLAFLVGAWAFWQHAEWWPVAVGAAAAASLLTIVLAPSTLRLGPYGSAFVFNALTLLVLLAPQGRRLLAGL
ncbi:MAG: hypothetical protein ACRDJN_11180 [Chloroflexota bacterium]